jgi:hypothetical protein
VGPRLAGKPLARKPNRVLQIVKRVLTGASQHRVLHQRWSFIIGKRGAAMQALQYRGVTNTRCDLDHRVLCPALTIVSSHARQYEPLGPECKLRCVSFPALPKIPFLETSRRWQVCRRVPPPPVSKK